MRVEARRVGADGRQEDSAAAWGLRGLRPDGRSGQERTDREHQERDERHLTPPETTIRPVSLPSSLPATTAGDSPSATHAIRDQEEVLQDSYAPEDPTKHARRQEAGPCSRYTGRRNYQGRTTPGRRQLIGMRRPVAT